MSHFAMSILLHYLTRTGDPSSDNLRTDVYIPEGSFFAAIRGLMDHGLLQISTTPGQDYELTERGQAYLSLLLDVPIPVSRWVNPYTNEQIAYLARSGGLAATAQAQFNPSLYSNDNVPSNVPRVSNDQIGDPQYRWENPYDLLSRTDTAQLRGIMRQEIMRQEEQNALDAADNGG